jgi:hypothetical protein
MKPMRAKIGGGSPNAGMSGTPVTIRIGYPLLEINPSGPGGTSRTGVGMYGLRLYAESALEPSLF